MSKASISKLAITLAAMSTLPPPLPERSLRDRVKPIYDMDGYDQYGLISRALGSDNPFGTIRRSLTKKAGPADPEKKKQRKAQGKARLQQRRKK